MKEVEYVDDESFQKEVDKAINNAVANLAMEGFVVTDKEKEELKRRFIDSYSIKLVRRDDARGRHMG